MKKHFTKEQIEELRSRLITNPIKDSDLPYAGKLTNDDIVAIVQNGNNKKISVNQLRTELEEGPRGESAYEVSVRHGYSGTEEEWLADPVNGIKGNGIKSCEVQESTSDSGTSTITVEFDKTNPVSFNVKNGKGIVGFEIQGSYSPLDGAVNTYKVTYSDGTESENIYIKNGNQGSPAVAVENYVTVEATAQTTAATDVLPAVGSADTLYRVACWDGTQYNNTVYSVYGWHDGAYRFLEKKEVGIDDEPTADSQNFVKSGGVATKFNQLGQELFGTTINDVWDALLPNPAVKKYTFPINVGDIIKVQLTNTGSGSSTIVIDALNASDTSIENILPSTTIVAGGTTGEISYVAPVGMTAVRFGVAANRSTYDVSIVSKNGEIDNIKSEIDKENFVLDGLFGVQDVYNNKSRYIDIPISCTSGDSVAVSVVDNTGDDNEYNIFVIKTLFPLAFDDLGVIKSGGAQCFAVKNNGVAIRVYQSASSEDYDYNVVISKNGITKDVPKLHHLSQLVKSYTLPSGSVYANDFLIADEPILQNNRFSFCWENLNSGTLVGMAVLAFRANDTYCNLALAIPSGKWVDIIYNPAEFTKIRILSPYGGTNNSYKLILSGKPYNYIQKNEVDILGVPYVGLCTSRQKDISVSYSIGDLLEVRMTDNRSREYYYYLLGMKSGGGWDDLVVNSPSGQVNYVKLNAQYTSLRVYQLTDSTDFEYTYELYLNNNSAKIALKPNTISVDTVDNILELPTTLLSEISRNIGYGSIIHSWGFVGDSLTSGCMECWKNNTKYFVDMFDYSWGQRLCKLLGVDGYNFSYSGQTTRGWIYGWSGGQGTPPPETTPNPENRIWDDGNGHGARYNPKQGYIIALGVNDAAREEYLVGSTSDVNLNDYTQNGPTFCGYYGGIIQRLRSIQPECVIFCVTSLNDSTYDEKIREVSALFDKCYLIDLAQYAPSYGNSFRERYYLNGHLDAAGYQYTAYMFNTYLDWIIRNNWSDFVDVSLIGTEYTKDND